MYTFRHRSTLLLLCAFVFTALALSNDALVIPVGGFKLSYFDILFVGILLVKGLRMADPAAYTLPPANITLLLGINLLATGYLIITAPPAYGVETGDVFRDLRIVFYFVATPYLCYKDIDSRAAYRTLQWAIVASGITVSVLMLAKQAMGFSTAEPVRDLNLGIWALPMSIVSLLYFREMLGLKQRTAYFLIMFMFMALVFSLNRSQYLQLGISVGIAVLLGSRVRAFRSATIIFAPAILAGLMVFYAIGYLDVLSSRVLSVEALDDDSSYGARVQEYEGQMDLFREKPILGHGPGFRSYVMGEEGFELSTFAHNSWAFYLMKFGVVGTIVIMGPCVLLLLMSLGRRYRNPELEMHRRYLIACVPIYILIDSMSGGLAYAPKTAFTGFLLCYCLSLLRNDGVAPVTAPAPGPITITPVAPIPPITPQRPVLTAWPPQRGSGQALPGPSGGKPPLPRLPHHG
jgi:O-antigen ligase